MASASATKMAAKAAKISGCWNAACRFCPSIATTTPATVYVSAIARTNVMDKRECPGGADRRALTDDDTGQDRHHGQHAGGKCKQQAKTEEGGDHPGQGAVPDQRREPVLLGYRTGRQAGDTRRRAAGSCPHPGSCGSVDSRCRPPRSPGRRPPGATWSSPPVAIGSCTVSCP